MPVTEKLVRSNRAITCALFPVFTPLFCLKRDICKLPDPITAASLFLKCYPSLNALTEIRWLPFLLTRGLFPNGGGCNYALLDSERTA